MSHEVVIDGTQCEASLRRSELAGVTLVGGRSGSGWLAARSATRIRLANRRSWLAFRTALRSASPRATSGRRGTSACDQKRSDRVMRGEAGPGRRSLAAVVVDEPDGEAESCALSWTDMRSSGSDWI